MKEKNKEPLFHIVKRDALPWYKSLGIRFVAILLALILCGIITTITTGINPYRYISLLFWELSDPSVRPGLLFRILRSCC